MGSKVVDYFAKIIAIYTIEELQGAHSVLITEFYPYNDKPTERLYAFLSNAHTKGKNTELTEVLTFCTNIGTRIFDPSQAQHSAHFFLKASAEDFLSQLSQASKDKLISRKECLITDITGPSAQESRRAEINQQAAKLKALIKNLSIDFDTTKNQANKNPLVGSYFIQKRIGYKSPTIQLTKRNSTDIDQRIFYQSADSAILWNRFAGNNEEYHSQDFCLNCLERLTRNPQWVTDIQRNPNINSYILLGGGGSVFKDKALIRPLLNDYNRNSTEEKKKTHKYIIVDTSSEMIHWSRVGISQWFSENKSIEESSRNYLKLNFVHDDILDLAIDDTHEGKVFFLLAGTFGNLKEKLFAKKVSELSRKNDYLVIGINGITEKQYLEIDQTKCIWENFFKEIYTSEQPFNMMRPAVAQLIDSLISQGRLPQDQIPSAYKITKNSSFKVKKTTEDDETGVKALVPNLIVTINGKDFNIFKSSRYVFESVERFFLNYGWNLCEDLSEFIESDKLDIPEKYDSEKIHTYYKYLIFKKS